MSNRSLFSRSVSLFLFCYIIYIIIFVCFIFSIPHMNDKVQVCFSLTFILLSILPCMFIHVAANDIISFFLIAE